MGMRPGPWRPSSRWAGPTCSTRAPRSCPDQARTAATGEPVVDFVSGTTARSAAQVGDAVWEDATTLLATVTQGPEQYVVRATIDGRVEQVTEPHPAEMSVEYRFPAHPFG